MLAKPGSITISMRYARDLIDAAVERGVLREDLLNLASIDQALLDNPRARLNLKPFSRLYAGIVAALRDEEFGLHRVATRIGSAEMLCRVGTTTSTFAECAQVMARACNVALGAFMVECLVEDDTIELRFHEREPDAPKRLLRYEVSLLTMYAMMSWMVGQRLPLLSAGFPCAAPRHPLELRNLLGRSIRFRQPYASLCFAGQARDLPVIRNANEIPRFIRRAPGSLIEALLVRESLASEVRRVLQQALPVQLSLNQVAERLAVSPRTLHRKLEESDTSFQGIKDDVRRDLALHLLSRGSTPLKQIATRLGFSDQSTFQRAFMLWTGVPPGEYRRRTRI